jgi:integrase
MWVMKYRLPDGSESMRTLGAAWVKRDPEDAKGWLPRRGRPPEGTLNEDAARAALRAFLDQQTERTPLERISFERCADAFLEHCRERGRSPTTLRTYTPIASELKARWQDWRAVDVDADELEDYRDELAERGLAGSTLNQRRAVLSGIFKVAQRRFRVNVDPMDGFERAEVEDSGDFEVYSVEEVWALVRAAGSGLHHTGQRAYTRTSKSGRQVHIPERPFTAEELAGRRQQDLYDAAAIFTAALCGLRRSELLGLLWRAVLWDQQTILVRAHSPRWAGTGSRRASACTRSRPHSRCSTCSRACRHSKSTPSPTTASSRESRAPRWTARRCIAATASSRPPPASGRCASTTSAIPSAPRRSPPERTSWTSRSGWVTATSRPRCATSITSRATRPPRASAATSPARHPSSTHCSATPVTSRMLA